MTITPNAVFTHEHVQYRAVPVLLAAGRSVHECANCAGEYDEHLCSTLPLCDYPRMIFVRTQPALAG